MAARKLTLSLAIDGWLARAARPNKSAKSDRIRELALHKHFAPLHARDVSTITVADVAGVLRELAPETAVKSHTAVRAVFDYAIVMLEPHGVRFNNPADKRLLRHLGWSPKSRSENRPQPAIDWRLLPSVVSELGRMDGAAAACGILMIATGMRAKTARLAKWANIDLAARTWTPPLVDLKEASQAPFRHSSQRPGARCAQSPAHITLCVRFTLGIYSQQFPAWASSAPPGMG